MNVAQHRDYKLIEDDEILCVILFNFIHLLKLDCAVLVSVLCHDI